MRISVRKNLYEVWTVGCFNCDFKSIGDCIVEFAHAIHLKCGTPPYRMYVTGEMNEILEDLGLTREWEVTVTDEIANNSIMLAAGDHPMYMGRFSVYNLKGLI